MTVDTYTTPGADTWVCPGGITSVDVEVWGGGGGGGGAYSADYGGGGGGGGAYSKKTIAVTPSTSYDVYVGAAGAGGSYPNGSGTAGGDSYFNTSGTVMAKGGGGAVTGGNKGTGGAAASGVGDTKYSGGDGGALSVGETGCGGGASAGTASDGTSIVGYDQQTGASAVSGGGPGGDGGNASSPGNAPASGIGGGGGGGGKGSTGGAGWAGKVTITYADPTISPTGIASAVAFGSPTVTPGTATISPTGIASAVVFGSPSVLLAYRLLPNLQYELSTLDVANKVYVIVKASDPLVSGSATNTTVAPTYANSPREVVVIIDDGDATKCNTVAAAQLAFRQEERIVLVGLPVPLRYGLSIERGTMLQVVIPELGINGNYPVLRLEHDFASDVTLIDLGEFMFSRDDATVMAEIGASVAQLRKEIAVV